MMDAAMLDDGSTVEREGRARQLGWLQPLPVRRPGCDVMVLTIHKGGPASQPGWVHESVLMEGGVRLDGRRDHR